MISQTAEYALRAAVFLAEHPQTAFPIPRIALATQVPPQYLAKVMQDLARQLVVTSTRGAKGGYALARPANEVTLYEIVQAVDPIMRIMRCPLGLAAHSAQLCTLHARIDGACAAFEATCRQTTLGELLDQAALSPAAGGRPWPLR